MFTNVVLEVFPRPPPPPTPCCHMVFVTVFLGNCLIFHCSHIANFDHSFELPNVDYCKECCGELLGYVVKNIYVLGVRVKGSNVVGCVVFVSIKVASCFPKLPLS